MIDPGIPPLIDDLAQRLQAHFGVAPSTLARQLKKIGREMPGKWQRRVRVLAQAEAHMGHPKLSRQADLGKVQQAHADLLPYLKTVDLTHRRTTKIIGIIGSIAFNLLILGAIIAAFLYWRSTQGG